MMQQHILLFSPEFDMYANENPRSSFGGSSVNQKMRHALSSFFLNFLVCRMVKIMIRRTKLFVINWRYLQIIFFLNGFFLLPCHLLICLRCKIFLHQAPACCKGGMKARDTYLEYDNYIKYALPICKFI